MRINDADAVWSRSITKIRLYNFEPLKPHFYIVKLGFIGVYIILVLFLLKSIDCGCSLEPPRRRVPNLVLSRNIYIKKKQQNFHHFFFYYLVVYFSIYLNWRVFVMFAILNVNRR